MRTVVLTYARARRPNLRPLVGLLGGCVVGERDEALAVRFTPDALAGIFCRVIDKLRLPVLMAVVDDPPHVEAATVDTASDTASDTKKAPVRILDTPGATPETALIRG